MRETETHSDRTADAIDEADPFTEGDATGIRDAAWDDIGAQLPAAPRVR